MHSADMTEPSFLWQSGREIDAAVRLESDVLGNGTALPEYPRPRRPLDAIGLLDKAVEANVAVVQIADNLPLHELPDTKLDQLREAVCARADLGSRHTRH
jgi:hypothetical protein